MRSYRPLALLVIAVICLGTFQLPAAAAEPAPPEVARPSLASFGVAAPAALADAAAPAATHRLFLPSLSKAGPAPAPTPTSLLRLNYYHVRDADGWQPGRDVEIAMAFEPGGVVQLYVARPNEVIAYRGSYSYNGGRLALRFADDDFHPNVSFALDTASATVTMPFNVFTPDTPGPSTWRRAPASIENNMWMIFTAATVNERLPIPQAIARARAYAQALVGQPARVAGMAEGEELDGPALQQVVIPTLVNTSPLAEGVRLHYERANGQEETIDVQLFGYGASAADAPLATSPLAGDPRVHLNQIAGLNGADDPPNKSALLVAPFYTGRILAWNPLNPASTDDNERRAFDLNAFGQTLGDNGYQVTKLADSAASVISLINALRTSPSFVFFSTHGSADGQLLTGTFIGTEWSESSALERYAEEKRAIEAAGFGSLLTYRHDGQRPLNLMAIRNGMTKRYNAAYITITPAFWHWLREQGADFGHSVVYTSACSTAATPNLRDAIRARVFFGYDEEVTVGTSAAVAKYLIASLARNTRTPEEVYYNILRVARTRLKIYQEDNLLDRHIAWGSSGETVADHLQGYVTLGPDSNSGPTGIMSFNEAGWLGAARAGKVAAGDVWYLLFSARWSQNAETGGTNLISCWNAYWSLGRSPGLASPLCQNMQPGSPPNRDEVAYAHYLLTGEQPLSFSGVTLPRWTLNDTTP